ncbi:MAG: hypothetical protein ACON5G_02275, partial [Pirellulaceae bacterium]
MCCSRSFGSRIGTLEEVEAAVASHVKRAVRKMRSEGSVANG